MKKLNEKDMYLAAHRRLGEHLATRPATRPEAERFAARERAAAADLRAQIAKSRRLPTISSLLAPGERGAHVIEMQHELGRAENERCKWQMHLESEAQRHEARAQSWDLVAAGPAGAVWDETRRELMARVEFYADRVAAEAAE